MGKTLLVRYDNYMYDITDQTAYMVAQLLERSV